MSFERAPCLGLPVSGSERRRETGATMEEGTEIFHSTGGSVRALRPRVIGLLQSYAGSR